MTYIIAEPCIDIKDRSCIDVCPVDCIYEYDRILVIDPEECIDCGVCEPECPWEAIFEDERVPGIFADDVGLNAAILKSKPDFQVPETVEKQKPTPEQVAGNKAKWGLSD